MDPAPPAPPTLAEAEAMDAADPLAPFRARFRLPPGLVYLDGNSLGALPVDTPARVAAVVGEEWGRGLIASWDRAGWMAAPARIGAKIARLVGADADEVIVADSTTVDLFKLTVAAAELRPGAVLAVAGDFPTDLHVARRAAELIGRPLRVVAADAVEAALDEDVAVAVLAHVHYRSARRLDMAALTARARTCGARIVWALSHSVGALPLDLRQAGAELAVGCGYKFLNGGPGAPAFLYVARALGDRLRSPIAGWIGHAAPFAFEDEWRPGAGAARFAAGTPPVLGLAALEVGVDLMLEADPALVWAKSCRLFDLFAALAEARCPALALASPREPDRRGSHVAFRHPDAGAIVAALAARGVVGDHRPPDVLRFGLTPLTLGYADVWHAADHLAAILDGGEPAAKPA